MKNLLTSVTLLATLLAVSSIHLGAANVVHGRMAVVPIPASHDRCLSVGSLFPVAANICYRTLGASRAVPNLEQNRSTIQGTARKRLGSAAHHGPIRSTGYRLPAKAIQQNRLRGDDPLAGDGGACGARGRVRATLAIGTKPSVLPSPHATVRNTRRSDPRAVRLRSVRQPVAGWCAASLWERAV